MTSLTPGTVYYVREYATNSAGTAYGNEVSFTTSATAAILPALTITAVTAITSTTATSGGNITSNGGSAVTARGVCWATNTSPTIGNGQETSNSSGSGSFVSNIIGLEPGTNYYVRAYATNSAGTAYGNEISFTATLAIGDSYQGGKIAYILQPEDPGYIAGQTHGLIAALSDQGTDVWGCYGTAISGADGTAIGTGLQNTIDIMGDCATTAIAARLCRGVTINDYSDWYLPSKDELNKLYLSRVAIGGFGDNVYWSSTEYNPNYAWYQNFTNGFQYYINKNSNYYVRAVQTF